eukprot:4741755-Amphidinium_carterae.1
MKFDNLLRCAAWLLMRLQELDVQERRLIWVFSDPELDLFSKEVEPHYLHHANAVTRGEWGIVPQPGEDDEYIVAQRIPAQDLGKWMEGKRSGAGRHARLCPSRDGPDGARRATLAQSLADYKEVKMVGWPFQGPGAVLELLKGIEASGLSFTTFHSHWAKSSGVNVASAISIEHSLNL